MICRFFRFFRVREENVETERNEKSEELQGGATTAVRNERSHEFGEPIKSRYGYITMTCFYDK